MAAPNQSPTTVVQLSFSGGMKSQLDPITIPGDDYRKLYGGGAYRVGLNVINRGGFVSTRPGHSWKVTFPGLGTGYPSNAQGSAHFKTFEGEDFLVVAVDGAIYYANYPFNEWKVFPVRLRQDVSKVYFAVCEQALKKNPDGSVSSVSPRRVLVVQDGYSRPLVWDASAPAKSVNDVPTGTVMAWSGNRLWVADGPQLYASDIGDPTSFDETGYIGVGGSFLFPLRITGMAETSDGNQLFVWTESSTHSVASGVRDRNSWQTTQNFIRTVSSTVGCVSSNSIRQQYGLLWWMSRDGLSNFNTARNTLVDSVFPVLDAEMAISKGSLHSDLSRCCIGSHGNFLLVSVPYGSTRNKHTWVMDATPLASVTEQNAPPVWASIWTGTNPTSWISGFIAGASRCFQLSLDDDGFVSMWESFTDHTDDHGVPISWALETRGFGTDGFARMELKRADLRFGNIRGDHDLAVFVAPSQHGAYKRILTNRTHADVRPLGTVLPVTPATEIPGVAAGQFRQFKTAQPRSSLSISCDPQVPEGIPERDSSFSFLLYGLGYASFTGIRLVWIPDSENLEGSCKDEGEGATVRAVSDGTAFTTDWADIPFTSQPFLGTATKVGYGGQPDVTADAVSFISQEAADRLALAIADSRAVTRYLSTESTGEYLPQVRVETPPNLPS